MEKLNSFMRILKTRNKENYKQILRWLVVGCFTVLLDALVFTIFFNANRNVIISNFISGAFATSINYSMHNKFTFKSDNTLTRSKRKYLLTLLLFWCLNTIFVKFLLEIFSNPSVAKIIVAIIQSPFNFIVLKNYVFKKK